MASKQKIAAVSGLLFGATVWGLIWYPYRLLENLGVSGALASLITYLIPLAAGWLAFRPASGGLRRHFGLLAAIGLTAGWCNLAYVLAVLHGEVMRVLLLFYLSPLWTVMLAHFLLGERPNGYGWLVMAMAFCGALVMLWRTELGMPLPANSAEWLALSAGFMFAASNVLSRRGSDIPVNLKSLGVWGGVSLLSACALPWAPGAVGGLGGAGAYGWGLLVFVGTVIFLVTVAVQYGLGKTPANQAIVIFLFELVVAAVSSHFLAGETMGLREWLGGALIVAATLFSGRMESTAEAEK